ncbi:MAG TPA: hypothetical protein PKE03_10205 [Bacteroidales bacterium]|nr:hypothetical protein [Bacteroidales bacterium]
MTISTKKLSSYTPAERRSMIPELDQHYHVVTLLPDTIEPGRLVLFNGRLWRGLLPGESSLPVGIPIPAAGYWSSIFNGFYGPALRTDLPVTISSDQDGILLSYNINIPLALNHVVGIVSSGRIEGPGISAIFRSLSFPGYTPLSILIQLSNLSGNQLTPSNAGMPLTNFNGRAIIKIYPPAP